MSNSNTPFLQLQDRVIDALLRAFSPARRACARAEQLISINADGEATEAERRELAAHLERCPGCRALENATLLVRADLRERPRAALPDTLAARLAATIENEQRRERVEALERGSNRRVAAPRLRLGLAGGVVGVVFAGFLTFSVLHQPQQAGHLAHPVEHSVISAAANHPAPHGPVGEPANLASVPRSHSVGHGVPEISQSKPTNIASGEIDSSRPEIEGKTAQPSALPTRRSPVQQLNRQAQLVAVKPAETDSFFPGRVKLPATSLLNRAKPLHAGGGVNSRIVVTHAPGDEIAGAGIHSGKNDVFHFPAPGKSGPSDVQVAANDVPSQPLRQPDMQSSLTSELRNLAGGTQRAQIRSTKVTISLAAYPSNSSSTSNGASLVYAPANL